MSSALNSPKDWIPRYIRTYLYFFKYLPSYRKIAGFCEYIIEQNRQITKAKTSITTCHLELVVVDGICITYVTVGIYHVVTNFSSIIISREAA